MKHLPKTAPPKTLTPLSYNSSPCIVVICIQSNTFPQDMLQLALKYFFHRHKLHCLIGRGIVGDSLRKSIVYQATVTTEDSTPDETYVGLTENTFKTRFTNHKTSFNNPSKRMSTELGKHVWNLKDRNI